MWHSVKINEAISRNEKPGTRRHRDVEAGSPLVVLYAAWFSHFTSKHTGLSHLRSYMHTLIPSYVYAYSTPLYAIKINDHGQLLLARTINRRRAARYTRRNTSVTRHLRVTKVHKCGHEPRAYPPSAYL